MRQGFQTTDGHTFIFVGGLHRSGTTAVASALASSPLASGLTNTGATMDEGQFLQDAYPRGSALGGPTGWALNPGAHLTEADVADPHDLRDTLWRAWSPYWDTSRPILVEKTPLNILRTRYLQAAFPDSAFLIVVRHPVLQALAVEKWYPDLRGKLGFRLASLVELWCVAHETLRTDLPHLRRVSVATYERLVEDPVAEFARVGAELGLTADLGAGHLAAGRSNRYRRRWERSTPQDRKGSQAKTRRQRGPVNVREILRDAATPFLRREYLAVVREYESRVQAFGYSFDDLDAVEPWRA